MILEERLRSSNNFIVELSKACAENKEFKERLIQSPKITLEEYTGKKLELPNGINLEIEDQSDSNYVYLNIPRKIALEDLQLSDEELEQVAGGDITAGAVALGIATGVLATWGATYLDGYVTGFFRA